MSIRNPVDVDRRDGVGVNSHKHFSQIYSSKLGLVWSWSVCLCILWIVYLIVNQLKYKKTIIDLGFGQHMICKTFRQNVARGRRPRHHSIIAQYYKTEFSTKWKDSVGWYAVATCINSTMKPCSLLVKFHLSIVSHVSRLRWWSLYNQRVVSSSPNVDRNFSFCNPRFSSLQLEGAHAN